MKVSNSVDMEGVFCIAHGDDVKLEERKCESAREWMTAEANAAIQRALFFLFFIGAGPRLV